MGLLRMLTNSHVMDGEPLSLSKAWDVRDRFSDARIGFIREPEGFEAEWRKRRAPIDRAQHLDRCLSGQLVCFGGMHADHVRQGCEQAEELRRDIARDRIKTAMMTTAKAR